MDIYFLGRTPQRTTGNSDPCDCFFEKYAGYQIDDADFVETPDEGEYYLVELEKGELEVKVKVNAEGEFI